MKSLPLILAVAVAGWGALAGAAHGQEFMWDRQHNQWVPPNFPLIAPPHAEDVAGISTNMEMLDYGSGDLYVSLDKERVLEFLRKGKAQAYDKEGDKLMALADKTLPGSIMNDPRLHFDAKTMAGDPTQREYANETVRAEGVLVTKKHQFYFWELWNDQVLELKDSAGGACLLVMTPDAGTSAKYLKLYRDFPAGPDGRAIGKLALPKPGEVVAFANRRDGSAVRFPVSEARVMKFLAHGRVDFPPMFDGPDRRMPLAVRPETLEAATRRRIGNDENDSTGLWANANGVMATRDGEIIFWSLVATPLLRAAARRQGGGGQ